MNKDQGMKTRYASFFLLLMTISLALSAQVLKPKIIIEEHPITHNAHICFDGKFYYTVNGGIADHGTIHKISKKGKIIGSYSIDLDMRTIMYDKNRDVFFVSSFDGNVYEITNMENGAFELLHKSIYKEKQSSIALSKNGNYFYCNEFGTVSIYDSRSAVLIKRMENFNCGESAESGGLSIAVSKDHIYTFDPELHIIYCYTLKGKLVESFDYSDGDFACSLSFANKMVFIAKDGNYEMGYWYGYKLK